MLNSTYIELLNSLACTQARMDTHKVEVSQYVSPKVRPTKTETVEQENTEMTTTEFRNERYALERDLSNAAIRGSELLAKKHHMHAHQPATVREALAMVKADKYETLEDKTLDRKLEDWESPWGYIILREHPADKAAHDADYKKLEDEHRALKLAIATTQDPDKTRVETEKFRKTWVH